MHSVKVLVFSRLEADFDAWKMRFKAFYTKQGYGQAFDDFEEASADMQLELYTSLVLALSEDDSAHIEETDEKDPKCGFLAWQALMSPLGKLRPLQTRRSPEGSSRSSARC